MICLDSWIWLEYVFEDDNCQKAEEVIETASSSTTGGILPSTVIAEGSHIKPAAFGAT